MQIKLDLHDIFSNGRALEAALTSSMEEAQEKHAKTLEIIPGKGSAA